MKGSIILFMVFVLFCPESFCQADNEWKLKKDKDEISVYTRQAEDSDIIEIKVISNVKATVDQVSAMLADVETYKKWMPNVKSTKILEEVSNEEKYYYIELNAPWPISNRDNIIHYHHTADEKSGTVKIFVNGVPDYLPETPGIVRIVRSNGIWQLTPNANGETEILSTYLSDPSGSLPFWVIKMFVVGSIYDTFVNLKNHVEDENQEE